MPDGLSSIEGLADKHERVLARHHVTDLRGLVQVVVTDTSDWHTAASFVVIFSQRQREDAWERRIEVERTEVEPERNPQIWPGWACPPSAPG